VLEPLLERMPEDVCVDQPVGERAERLEAKQESHRTSSSARSASDFSFEMNGR
jgi:hypothetical protein